MRSRLLTVIQALSATLLIPGIAVADQSDCVARGQPTAARVLSDVYREAASGPMLEWISPLDGRRRRASLLATTASDNTGQCLLAAITQSRLLCEESKSNPSCDEEGYDYAGRAQGAELGSALYIWRNDVWSLSAANPLVASWGSFNRAPPKSDLSAHWLRPDILLFTAGIQWSAPVACDNRGTCEMSLGKRMHGIIVSTKVIKEVLRLDLNMLTLRSSVGLPQSTGETVSLLNAAGPVILATPAQSTGQIPGLEIVGLRANGSPTISLVTYSCWFIQDQYQCAEKLPQ